MSAGLIQVEWVERSTPLEPGCVVARGEAALALADRVIARPGDWQGVVGDRLLVLLGEELPWVDGVAFMGRAWPGLWLDTRWEPTVPLGWLARRLCRSGPVAWVRAPDLVIPLTDAAPLHLPTLQAWRNRA